ncbi:hypothetical protein I4U23_016247 [Adineta vaga]|nr:hypothetical protein I4U23_016247 [Adineta vaga]
MTQIFAAMYVPEPKNTNASLISQFSTNCNECLCQTFLFNITYAIINCQRDTKLCLFYEHFTINYTVQLNLNVSVYFFQLSSVFTTNIISNTYTSPMTSITVTTEQTTNDMSTQTPQLNVWRQIQNMTVARIGHTSTYIPETGNVLIIGGENQSSIELFVSANESFIRKGNMTNIRTYHTTDRLSTNVILIAGGNTVDLYDPIEEKINTTINMSTPRAWHKSSTINIAGNIKTLLSGGVPGNWSASFLSSANLFDSSTNTFTSGIMSVARYYQTSTSLPNGNIIIAGGQTIGNGLLNSLELFNSSSNSFLTIAATMSNKRYYHTATYIPSIQSILFAGGYISSNLNTYDLFNVTTLTFVRNGTFKYARSAHTATLLKDERILLVGGYPYITQVEIFNPLTFTFSVAANLSIGRSYHTATLLDHSGQVLVCGGDGASGYLKTCELYQP